MLIYFCHNGDTLPILISMEVSNFDKFNLVPGHISMLGNYIYLANPGLLFHIRIIPWRPLCTL